MIKITIKKTVAFLLILLFMLVIISSIGYLVVHADHHCIGENCPVCFAINTTKKIMKIIETAVIITVFALLRSRMATLILTIDSILIFNNSSLFSQKVKLNN